MERLTKPDWNKSCYDACELCGMYKHCTRCEYEDGGCCRDCHILDMHRKLAEYENEEEQGLLIRMPCKLGETLFCILYERGSDEIIEVEVKEISIGYYLSEKLITIKAENKMRRGLMYQFQEDDFGVILFRSREEAEKKLKEMEEL